MSNSLQLVELDELCSKFRDIRDRVSDEKKLHDEWSKKEKVKSDELQNQIIEHMVHHKKKKYEVDGIVFEIKNNFSAKAVDKHLLFTFLKERGMFEDLAQIHAGTLKSQVKKWIDSGEMLTVPGVEIQSNYQTIKYK